MQQRKPNLINKAFNKYLWASVLTVAATQIANIVDAIIVGNLIGADALAAVNLSKPLLQAFFAVTCLYVASSTILAGMATGRNDRETADRLFTFSMAVSLVLGLVFSIAGLVWFRPLSGMLCQSEALRPLSDAFMRVTLFNALPQMLMLSLQQFVTMDGDPGMVSRAVIVGNVFNILLDIVFIRFFGWGIAGAAAATGVMYVVCMLMVLPHFRKKGSLRLCSIRPGDLEVGKVLTIGLPLFLSTVLMSVQYMGNNYVAGRYLGDDGLVALAVCMQLFAFSMIILTGTLRTIQPVGSILRGMGDSNGMLMLMKKAYSFMAVCFVVFTAILLVFPSQIGTMLGVSGESALETVRRAVPLFSLNIVLQALLCCLLPPFQLYDRKGLALLLSIAQTLLPMVFFLLLRGNWLGFFFGQLATGLVIAVWEMILRHRSPGLCRFFLIPMNDGTKLMETTLEPTIKSLSEAVGDMREFLASNGRDSRTANAAAVCAEEFVKNIIDYGHASSIDLSVTVKGDVIGVSIHDDGTAFDPVVAVKSSDSRIGLGLTIAKAFCKEMDYKYIFNQNMVTITIQS